MMLLKNWEMRRFQTQRHPHESRPLPEVLHFLECRQVTIYSEKDSLLKRSLKWSHYRVGNRPVRSLRRTCSHHALLSTKEMAEVAASDIHPLAELHKEFP